MLRSRLSAFLLSAALLLAQALAMVHGVHHAGGPARATALAAASASASIAGAVDALSGTHDGPVCRLIDQLADAEAPPCLPVLPLLALPPVLPQAWAVLFLPAAPVAAFLARGPPSSR